MDGRTWLWWTVLRVASVMNLAGLLATAFLVSASSAQLVCASVFTLVCAFRSFFPRVDLERTVLVDSWASAIGLGRSAATVAELAFTVQCGLLLIRLVPGPTGVALASILFGIIVIAQLCCWLGVVTLRHRWHAAEEALWALAMGIVAVSLTRAWPTAPGGLRLAIPFGVVASVGAAFVMLVLDIPMYLRRARVQERYLGIAEGFADAWSRRAPTGAWSVWSREVAWMTPYFTVAVWLSLLLVHL